MRSASARLGLVLGSVHPNAFSFEVLVLVSDDLKWEIFWPNFVIIFVSSTNNILGRVIGDFICLYSKRAWGHFVHGHPVVREPGGSIGTNFGSKAYSDF